METEEKFIPFGEEWQKQMMKMDKKELVQVIKKIAIENIDYQFEIRGLKQVYKGHLGAIEKTVSKMEKTLHASKTSNLKH